ncbi:3-hydroxyacyl-CoA dehydrogenase NAD-binding domain-containing protein [Nitrosococcus watsonii]|uniref:enoyl-CoA hydratase n=1 Tax=Nitrosococcus watsoni (strain C-113) TaxID=105559 RepID=D8K8J2_NITWC|nr:3-hydroxyacyl-CoA dehydrogenase NAD-binding domain-containing protein [Nitrosococcus watsonii]ADJ29112.1 3-hydroxyacyl-CoA dehydrogenase NAD-binding protein [Nitrosococcus watsonii C-113]
MNNNNDWYTEKDTDGIVWLRLNQSGTKTNVLSKSVLEALDRHLVQLATENPKGLVILSDKKQGFIAGADVTEFTALRKATEARAWIQRVHEIFNRLANLPFPTVAVIHGYCLGGGLELALACRYRVAANNPETQLGLPEVKLGIHPGYGGTVRLPRLIGTLPALEMMLKGRSLNTRAAARLGLIDQAVPSRHLQRAARAFIEKSPPPHCPPFWQRLIGQPPMRRLVTKILRSRLEKRVNSRHYPAPFALLELWEKQEGTTEQRLALEAESLTALLISETTNNLIRVFLLQQRLKSLGKQGIFKPERVHVIGAGTMGGDIATWCALKNLRVSLQDRSPEHIAPAIKRAHGLFKKRLKDQRPIQAAMDRLMPDPRGEGLAKADVLIEAIFENIEAKQALFQAIEPRLKAETLLATNTSSIPLETLAESLSQPERLVGLHFFNPVAKMQLVEVVKGEATTAGEMEQAAAFTRQIGRLPLPVKSLPGFLVNRVLTPYLLEATRLLSEGVPGPVIDQAAIDFGMPMGPIELADTVGLDICLSVAERLTPSEQIPEELKLKIQQGQLGKKSGNGFYRYQRGKPVKPQPPQEYQAPGDLTDRLILSMINEAVSSLHDRVVEDADLLDAGMIFGIGFAPFRGGPLHYVRTQGVKTMRQRLQALEAQYGTRFTPSAGWQAL